MIVLYNNSLKLLLSMTPFAFYFLIQQMKSDNSRIYFSKIII